MITISLLIQKKMNFYFCYWCILTFSCCSIVVQKGRQVISKSKKISNFFLIKTKASSVYDVCLFVFVQSLLNTHCFLHLRLSLISRRYNFDEHVGFTYMLTRYTFAFVPLTLISYFFHFIHVVVCLILFVLLLLFSEVWEGDPEIIFF